jgi:hypothetical protein
MESGKWKLAAASGNPTYELSNKKDNWSALIVGCLLTSKAYTVFKFKDKKKNKF